MKSNLKSIILSASILSTLIAFSSLTFANPPVATGPTKKVDNCKKHKKACEDAKKLEDAKKAKTYR